MLDAVSGFVVPLHESMKTSGGQGFLSRVGNLVSSELLDDELVVGFVCIERIDDIIASSSSGRGAPEMPPGGMPGGMPGMM